MITPEELTLTLFLEEFIFKATVLNVPLTTPAIPLYVVVPAVALAYSVELCPKTTVYLYNAADISAII